MRPCRNWSISRSLIVKFLDEGTTIALQIGLPVTPLGFVWVQPTPDLIVRDIQQFANFNKVQTVKTAGFWFGVRDLGGHVGEKACTDEKVILNLHVMSLSLVVEVHHSPPMLISVKASWNTYHKSNVFFATEYRLAAGPPYEINNPFPAALIDIIAGYRYLLDLGFEPRNIIVASDSCSGILAYQLLRYQAMYKLPELPMAGALLLFSPLADSALRADPGTSMVSNAPSDLARNWLQANYGAIE
ncbi:hypothetical protein D9758_016624 [Tetrapyrgos nigripes]|uniref:Alpha/beta hydrolase fold-3 domain-containing protein n=1 Tax=Tetrapyrgos nigripes TaxID=182062 RepID=A0A8H5FI84_9AGAR|nr:hypothetical protein D9758_016624 [Tetrapyrgos nigripes]